MKTQILPKLSFPNVSFRGARLMWVTTLASLGASAAMAFPPASASPYVGTMDTSSIWSIRSSLTTGPADQSFFYGFPTPGLVPLVGDWDGNGSDTVGVYEPSTSNFFLKNTNSSGAPDFAFGFGNPTSGFIPITGDWNNDGVDTIGIYAPSSGAFFLRNSNSFGNADNTFEFGAPGATPLTGDWNGDGIDTVGIYDTTTGFFFQTNTNQNGPGDIPPFTFGLPGNFIPIAGDWDLDGDDTIGLFSPSNAQWFLRDTNDTGAPDYQFQFGALGGAPVVGQVPEPAGLALLSAGCMALVRRRRA